MCTWYSTGTVAVSNGSATVTGTGTSWIGNVNVGDAVHLPDGKVYEVTGVVSATSLTIAPDYLGSTASAQSYSVQPTRALTVEFTTNATTLLDEVRGYVDGPLAGRFDQGSAAQPALTTSGDTDTGLYFPAIGQLAAATGGARRWLLSNSAFQVDVPIAGAAVQSSLIDSTENKLINVGAFGFGSNDVTLEQPPGNDFDALRTTGFWRSSGVQVGTPPVSASVVHHLTRLSGNGVSRHYQVAYSNNKILNRYMDGAGTWSDWLSVTSEFISNSNGQAVRLHDGTQIAWMSHNLGSATGNGSGTRSNPFHTSSVSINFPVAFSAVPEPGFSYEVSAGGIFDRAFVTTVAGMSSTEILGIRALSVTDSATARDVTLHITAVGRWY